jgi:D-beta-D-heptose 7-phosphate kinase / D-beta-D-heptose 1-phosphate adenosyltransferase
MKASRAQVRECLRVSKTVKRQRIMETLFLSPFVRSVAKIMVDEAALETRLDEWRHAGLRVGFTSGCFDLIHPGHIKLLEAARELCDRLVVGLNSDASLARLGKGEERPVVAQHARACVVAAFAAVDLVVIFDEESPLDLIGIVRPNVLIKGADYHLKNVAGADVVRNAGGQVVLIDLEPGYSTTNLVNRLRNRAETRKGFAPSP